MLKYSTFSVTSLNIYLARKVVIILLISGTLITSIAVTGQTFATTIGKPDIGIDDGIIIEGGAEDEEATDEDGNETTSERAVPRDQFCKQGTGGDTGKPCIPCDPGLPIPGCSDISTGGPLIQGEGDETESGNVTNPAILEELLSPDNTVGRAKIVFGNLEEQGIVPPKTTETIESLLDTEESTNALGTLCDIASADKSSKVGAIDCSMFEVSGDQPTDPTTVEMKCPPTCQEVVKAVIQWIVTEGLKGTAPGIDDAVRYCQQNPGACT